MQKKTNNEQNNKKSKCCIATRVTTEARIAFLEELVKRANTNRERIPADLLRTKYKKSYNELVDSIVRVATLILKEQTDDGSGVFPTTDSQVEYDLIQLSTQAAEALTKRFCVPEFLDCAGQIREIYLSCTCGKE